MNSWSALTTLGEVAKSSGVEAGLLLTLPADLVEELGELVEAMRPKETK